MTNKVKRGQRWVLPGYGKSIVTAVRQGIVYVLSESFFTSDGGRIQNAHRHVEDWKLEDFLAQWQLHGAAK